jgi:hypothetical protein
MLIMVMYSRADRLWWGVYGTVEVWWYVLLLMIASVLACWYDYVQHVLMILA